MKVHSCADTLCSVAPIQVVALALYQTRDPRSSPSIVSCFHVATGATAAIAANRLPCCLTGSAGH